MEFLYFLLNAAPFAPMMLGAGIAVYWLRSSRWACLGAGLVGVCAPGFFLTLYLRDVGFHAFGGICTAGQARGFMEAMQWVFLAQGITGVIGAAILAILAVGRNPFVGGLLLVLLVGASLFSAWYLFFAAGMTAVDGYAC